MPGTQYYCSLVIFEIYIIIHMDYHHMKSMLSTFSHDIGLHESNKQKSTCNNLCYIYTDDMRL